MPLSIVFLKRQKLSRLNPITKALLPPSREGEQGVIVYPEGQSLAGECLTPLVLTLG